MKKTQIADDLQNMVHVEYLYAVVDNVAHLFSERWECLLNCLHFSQKITDKATHDDTTSLFSLLFIMKHETLPKQYDRFFTLKKIDAHTHVRHIPARLCNSKWLSARIV